MAVTVACTSLSITARADSSKVVTLGANLSKQQKEDMYNYFGTSADKVETIEVTNKDERKYMEGIASDAQIGTRTYSCSYVEPTTEGGIQVKTANLTFVTSSMIASTLMTSGVENCNVVAASPIEVSGTGALTGIMMAYETASGEKLDEEQKETATEELITTGELADSIGQQEATDLMNNIKQEVIEEELTDAKEIEKTVDHAADSMNITLTEEQMAKIVALMEKIAQYDYDVNSLKDTLTNLEGKAQGWWDKVTGFFQGLFGKEDGDGGIINSTKDDILGSDIITDSTLDEIKEKAENEGWWDKIVGFFKGLFGNEEESDKAAGAGGTQNTDDAQSTDNADNTDNVQNAEETQNTDEADTQDVE